MRCRALVVVISLLVCRAAGEARRAGEVGPWRRHTIDRSSRGADGVRGMDVNGDGLMDIVTGWEEGGLVRAYLNPGKDKVRGRWPSVTAGKVRSPEDAVFVDLDADGAVDVVSSCEGRTRTVFVHWAPKRAGEYLDERAWRTQAISATKGKQAWMFALPMQIDARGGIDLVVGSKGRGASVGWLQAPGNPRDVAAWKLHRLYDAGWIMSLEAHDTDGDGDLDVVVSDRRGKGAGVLWLENPGPGKAAGPWREHRIGGAGMQVMFLTIADLDRDGLKDVITATCDGKILFLRRKSKTKTKSPLQWETHIIMNPKNTTRGKAVRVADIDLDGKGDLVVSHEDGGGRGIGVAWMRYREAVTDKVWDFHDISGREGAKFDLIQLLDLDGDGDLDVIGCEERHNLGVFWYENPTK